MEKIDRRPWLWLLLGVGLIYISQLRFGLGVLAWIAPVPWLQYLRLRSRIGARALVFAALMLAWTAAVTKIMTGSMPLALALGFGVPIGGVQALAFLGSDVLRRRLGENAGTLGFVALVVLCEWSLHGLLPFGTWGSGAHTQLSNLPLLQLASVTGLHGVSALIAAGASVIARLLASRGQEGRSAAAVTAVLLVATVAFGQARLAGSIAEGQRTRRVAAVGSDSTVGASPDWPDAERLAGDEAGLVHRTELAAAGGAKLVVWNEAATMVVPDDEAEFVDRLSALAARLEIELVAAYVVPLSREPLRYENKYRYFLKDGSEHHTYFKHEPVPGEPAVRGDGPAPVVRGEQGVVSGAICYDYDFPYLGLGHARSGVDLVVLPSSDWRGIDPIHTQMAALRAIEGGHSIVRSTRFGLSAGIDPQGRMLGRRSHFDGKERVLVVDLPTAGVTTFYGRFGDWFPLSALLLTLGLAVRVIVVAFTRDVDGSVSRLPRGARSV